MSQNFDFFNAYSLVHRPLMNHINRILEKHNLSSSYWRVLRILDASESKRFGEITDALYIEKPALTKIIKKLTEMGFVDIQRGQDKREKIVVLTSIGKSEMASIREELNPFLMYALKGLTEEQIYSTIDVLQKIQKNITSY